MKYKGIELVEITEPQIFNPPKQMLVWDNTSEYPRIGRVYVIGPSSMACPIRTISYGGCAESVAYQHCAEVPEEPKPRRATNRELAKWLAQGNGEMRVGKLIKHFCFEFEEWRYNAPVSDTWQIRKWDDTEWHEPTAEYMGLEE